AWTRSCSLRWRGIARSGWRVELAGRRRGRAVRSVDRRSARGRLTMGEGVQSARQRLRSAMRRSRRMLAAAQLAALILAGTAHAAGTEQLAEERPSAPAPAESTSEAPPGEASPPATPPVEQPAKEAPPPEPPAA